MTQFVDGAPLGHELDPLWSDIIWADLGQKCLNLSDLRVLRHHELELVVVGADPVTNDLWL